MNEVFGEVVVEMTMGGENPREQRNPALVNPACQVKRESGDTMP
ncbi:hypothetical protein [Streptomyces sp. bgisy100]